MNNFKLFEVLFFVLAFSCFSGKDFTTASESSRIYIALHFSLTVCRNNHAKARNDVINGKYATRVPDVEVYFPVKHSCLCTKKRQFKYMKVHFFFVTQSPITGYNTNLQVTSPQTDYCLLIWKGNCSTIIRSEVRIPLTELTFTWLCYSASSNDKKSLFL